MPYTSHRDVALHMERGHLHRRDSTCLHCQQRTDHAISRLQQRKLSRALPLQTTRLDNSPTAPAAYHAGGNAGDQGAERGAGEKLDGTQLCSQPMHGSARLNLHMCTPQVRQVDGGASRDALAEKYGDAPSEAAIRSMLSNEPCKQHVSELEECMHICWHAQILHAWQACRMSMIACRCTRSVVCAMQVEEAQTSVSGEFPAWLHGIMLRNGPGSFEGMRVRHS